MTKLQKIENKSFFVGGAVRDIVKYLVENNLPLSMIKDDFKLLLTKADIKDLDYLVGEGETTKSMLEAGFTVVGKDFPVFHHPITKDEYALPRIEKKVGTGYKGFEFITDNVSIVDDLSRRDFRINAMAISKDGELIDPFNGLQDIKDQVLHYTSEAFAEDPLRVLRGCRFLSRFPGYTLSDETYKLCFSIKDEIPALSDNRISVELQKALSSQKPSNYFRALAKMDILDILYPALYDMIGVEQRVDKHSEGDVFEHTMRVLDQVCKLTDDPAIRFAALFHDIGKPSTSDNGSFHGHEDPEIVIPLIDSINTKGLSSRYKKLAKMVAINHTFVHIFNEVSTKKVIKRMNQSHFPKTFDDFSALLTVSYADSLGRILGDRKLTFDEVESIYSGNTIDGFKIGSIPDYREIRRAFFAFSKKVVLSQSDQEKHFEVIKQIIHRKKISRVNKARASLSKPVSDDVFDSLVEFNFISENSFLGDTILTLTEEAFYSDVSIPVEYKGSQLISLDNQVIIDDSGSPNLFSLVEIYDDEGYVFKTYPYTFILDKTTRILSQLNSL